MTCKHHYIRTWVFEDTGQPSGLWSCVDCSLKFEPITQRTAAVGEDTKAWVGLMRGVRVEGDTVVISTKDNTVARDLCGALIGEKNT